MYLKSRVKIPDVHGKLTRLRRGDITYIKYEYDRYYDPEKKYTYPQRATIGKVCADDDTMMIPNEAFLKYFPDAVLSGMEDRTERSSCLRVGTYAAIHVPLDELRPSKDEELAAAGITKGTGADSAGTGIEQGLNDQTGSSETRQEPNDGIAVSGTPRESDDSTDVSGTEKEVSSGGTGEVYGPAVQISPVSTEEQEETDAKPVNGSVAKSFKETKVWYRNPFIWIGTATALAVIGIFGYHLKKRG